MSMKKTCPISNFTSEECSGGMGFVLSGNGVLTKLFPAGNLLHPPSPGFGATCLRQTSAWQAGRALDLGSSTSFRFWPRYFLHKGFEARIAAKIVEERIHFDDKQVSACAFAIGTFQFIDGVRFLAQRCQNSAFA